MASSRTPDKNAEDRALLALLDEGDAAGAWEGLRASAEEMLSGLAGLDDDAMVDASGEFDGPLIRDKGYRALWAANLNFVLRV